MKKLALLTLTLTFLAVGFSAALAAETSKPNVILIFADDQGYNDLGCFGSPKIKTPNIDKMAKEGMKLTSFYSSASVCTPSRASLMTGCYPNRVGLPSVLFPRNDYGLNPDEVSMADMFKEGGYNTACFGKWHLGHDPKFLPTNNGFDEYFGIPYSNDMGVDPEMKLAKNILFREKKTEADFRAAKGKLPPILKNDEVIEWPADQTTLTKRYTEHTIDFATKSVKEKKPFFIYLPQTMPHIPLFSTRDGQSEAGYYGDTIEEIDDGVGEILAALKKLGIQKNTLVFYTSDNGPWNLGHGMKSRRAGGWADPLRGYKFQYFEGGVREPCVAYWPGHIPADSVCDEIAATIDLLPTFAKIAGVDLKKMLDGKKIDGLSILPLLLGEKGAKTPHKAYFYRTKGVRVGDWKLLDNKLYNLKEDIAESKDLASENSKVVAELKALLDAHKKDLKENSRPAGREK